jgi:acyl dehydratase
VHSEQHADRLLSSANCIEVTDKEPARRLEMADLAVGQAVFQRFIFDAEVLQHFGEVAKDRAPVHGDRRFAQAAGFEAPIVQGLALATRFSRLIGMYLPGERAILQKFELRYRRPVYALRELIYSCRVARILRPMGVVQLALAIAMDGNDCVSGECQCLVR